MMDIVFYIIVYLLAGAAYCLVVWLLFKDDILKEQDMLARSVGLQGVTNIMIIINLIWTMIVWPYYWVRLMCRILTIK